MFREHAFWSFRNLFEVVLNVSIFGIFIFNMILLMISMFWTGYNMVHKLVLAGTAAREGLFLGSKYVVSLNHIFIGIKRM